MDTYSLQTDLLAVLHRHGLGPVKDYKRLVTPGRFGRPARVRFVIEAEVPNGA
jgi:hypothetical protein